MMLALRHAAGEIAFDCFYGIKRVERNIVGSIAAEQSAFVAESLSTGIIITMCGIWLAVQFLAEFVSF